MALERSRQGSAGADVWLSELVWRDFYFQILHHHPHVVERSFKPAYDAIAWETGAGPSAFAAWCEGRTGYPWWTRPWPKSCARATCTTACAWWWRVF
jgi:deoxyribodipyrimidine photo-lyase